MAKRRRKSKTTVRKEGQDAKGRRFIYTLIGVVLLFVIAAVLLRM